MRRNAIATPKLPTVIWITAALVAFGLLLFYAAGRVEALPQFLSGVVAG
ncbi:MAG: hypothetical protein SVW77_02660 [Candidatus Nanohaloarchaea archaeon]|nr:hypothetical protein [Candidatus Nanohaloarchaea archaeon]